VENPEFRLRAMADPASEAWYCLDDKDRAAINWLFDRYFQLKDQLDSERREHLTLARKYARLKEVMRKAARKLTESEITE
jgi:hypothetical protein